MTLDTIANTRPKVDELTAAASWLLCQVSPTHCCFKHSTTLLQWSHCLQCTRMFNNNCLGNRGLLKAMFMHTFIVCFFPVFKKPQNKQNKNNKKRQWCSSSSDPWIVTINKLFPTKQHILLRPCSWVIQVKTHKMIIAWWSDQYCRRSGRSNEMWITGWISFMF